jgi:hypothetical protein
VTWQQDEMKRRGILLDAIRDELEAANECFWTDSKQAKSRLLNALGLATDTGRSSPRPKPRQKPEPGA